MKKLVITTVLLSAIYACGQQSSQLKEEPPAKKSFIEFAQESIKNSEIKVFLSTDNLNSLFAIDKVLFGVTLSKLAKPMKQIFQDFHVTGLNLDSNSDLINIQLKEKLEIKQSDDEMLHISKSISVKSIQVVDEYTTVINLSGLSYGDQAIEGIKWNSDEGMLFQLKNKEEVAFDLEPILNFYDTHGDDFDSFFAQIGEAKMANKDYVYSLAEFLNWFKSTSANNVIAVNKTQNKEFFDFLTSHIPDVLGARNVAKNAREVRITPQFTTINHINNVSVCIQVGGKCVSMASGWTLQSHDANSVFIGNVKVKQGRVLRRDLWHPIYFARAAGDQLQITADVKPGPLLARRNITESIYIGD